MAPDSKTGSLLIPVTVVTLDDDKGAPLGEVYAYSVDADTITFSTWHPGNGDKSSDNPDRLFDLKVNRIYCRLVRLTFKRKTAWRESHAYWQSESYYGSAWLERRDVKGSIGTDSQRSKVFGVCRSLCATIYTPQWERQATLADADHKRRAISVEIETCYKRIDELDAVAKDLERTMRALRSAMGVELPYVVIAEHVSSEETE